MKALFGVVFIAASILVGNAQPVITYSNHALKADVDNPMTFSTYLSPGAEGINVEWDFSKLKEVKSFTGKVAEYNQGGNFYLANTELNEFGSRFLYDVNENGILQYGYISSSEKTQMVYHTPFNKLKFPFSYKNEFAEPFNGEYISNNEVIGDINGYSHVKADAWGTIVLPGNVRYENTLRVKSVKSYTITFKDQTQEVEITTYRWYNSLHRYPLLVLTETTHSFGKSESKSTQAAYNLDAAIQQANTKNRTNSQIVSVYPNPSQGRLMMQIESAGQSQAEITILDITGRIVAQPQVKMLGSGVNRFDFSSEISVLPEGLYHAKVKMGEEVQLIEIVVKK